ncbi:MAG: radical SAM protein [Clostridia bacterium]|nr:radical SAM protein [Clostridia bacterium]
MAQKVQIIIKSCDRRVLELEQVKNWFVANGYKISKNHWSVDKTADIIILTTCGVTQLHEDFTFETLERIKEGKKPGAKIILGGCVPEINPERVAREFGGATFSPKSYEKLDEIFDMPAKLDEFERPNRYKMEGVYRSDVGNTLDAVKFVAHLSPRAIMRGLRLRANNRKTFYIQIHEGCSMGCTYCAIQKAIGPLRNSKPIETVISEFREGLSKGYKYFRLIGDCAGSYGLDIKTNLGQLLAEIAKIEEPFHLELTDINPVFLKVIFDPVKKLCQQKRLATLYIPIQSGNDRVLGLMHRRYDIEETKRMLLELKESAPKDFRIGTSVIVGFPSETEEELKDTIDICNLMKFDWIYCHGFSPRPGTPAADLPGQYTEEEVMEKVDRFRDGIADRDSVVLDFK